MKKLSTTFILVFICIVSLAQNIERYSVRSAELNSFYEKEQYKYPAFTTSKIYLNNGDTAATRLNFNYFDQTIRYINEKGDTVAIANEKDVKYITIASDTFFYENGFYEWAASSATNRLAARHIFKLAERKTMGAFGTSSSAKNIQTVSTLGPRTYDLQANEELVFSKETTYYISPINGLKNNFILINKKNMSNLFPKKNVEDFIKENKLNLSKEEDILDLFIYVSKK